ncbi:MAG: VIT domain-containing protein [Lentisphaeria bacterium]|nr:VIT domain-containing protein [Lentisphaeria bacterium]
MKTLSLISHALCLIACPAVFACRIIIPPEPPIHPIPPHPAPVIRPMEVKQHDVEVTIRQGVASVVVEGTFHNPNNRRIEGTYLFPVSPRAAVSSFAMTVNGKTLEAELLEAGKARSIYEDIVRQVKDPALLEYAGQGLLKARVFPIEPGADVTVQLMYEEAVSAPDRAAVFTYPLLSVRPDAGVTIETVSLRVTLETKNPLKTLHTPGFDSVIKRQGNHAAEITFTGKNMVPDRDFRLYFHEDTAAVGFDFLAFEKNGQGYFMLAAAPDSELQMEEIAAKDITFILDTSGSMAGDKMRQAKKSLAFCVENVSDNDHFNIIAFSTDVHPFQTASLPATEKNRRDALAFIDDLRPRGGTAISAALAAALRIPPVKGKTAIIVFLTDGLPTLGETNPDKLLAEYAKLDDRRFYSFGLGYDVNTRLLDGLAHGGGGTSRYVRPDEDLELALSAFYNTIAFPVLTHVTLEPEGFTISDLNPRPLPSLFKGGQLMITGKFTGDKTRRLTLSGEMNGVREKFSAEVTLTSDPKAAFIPRLWAMGQVAWLQDQIRAHGADKELVAEIKHLGREYGILTEYTSFLIVEEGFGKDRMTAARREFMELERSAQMDSGDAAVENARLGGRMKGGWGLSAPSLSVQVSESKTMREVYTRHGISAEQIDRLVKQTADKTFYFRQVDNTWYDAVFAVGETPEIHQEITAWSPEYFKLLADHPELRAYLLANVDRQVIQHGARNILIVNK